MSEDPTKEIAVPTKRHMLKPDEAKLFDSLGNGECGPLMVTDAVAVELCKLDNSNAEIRIRHKTYESGPREREQQQE